MIKILTDKSKLNVTLIHGFLSNESYWAKGRSLETVEHSIENSLCFGLFMDEKQIGFARVVTDYVVFGWLMDVFVIPEYRCNGYGKLMIEHIINHEQLKGLKRIGLGTADAHGLYSQFGFSPLQKPENMMEKINE